MDVVTLLKALIMGIVEGLTEFLPVSSTGHLIVAGKMLAFPDRIAETFEIFIQLGAILAVLLFFARDLSSLVSRALKRDRDAINLLLGVAIAFVPAAIIGLLFRKQIKATLFNPTVVALALIVGGIVMLAAEAWMRRRASTVTSVDRMTWRHALGIGLAQVFSLIPGTSRSMTTIVGGMLLGLDRATAARFSFYLAIPVLGLASIYDFAKEIGSLRSGDLPVFIAGMLVAFVVAYLVIKFFLGYVSRNTFKPFAWYRIAAGVLMLLLFAPLFGS